MDTDLTTATRRALRAAPTSLRALAREAGVWHATLNRISRGELGASATVARAIAAALRRWGKQCLAAAERLDTALHQHRRTTGDR